MSSIIVIVFIIVLIIAIYEIKEYYFRSMDEIIPNMYLGNLRDANNKQLL